MRGLVAIALVGVLGGCGLIKTSSGGGGTNSGGGAGPGNGTRAEPEAEAEADSQPHGMENIISEAQITPIIGMTIEEGKAELARLGFTGPIEIQPAGREHWASCSEGHICEIIPDKAIPTHDEFDKVQLYVRQSQ